MTLFISAFTFAFVGVSFILSSKTAKLQGRDGLSRVALVLAIVFFACSPACVVLGMIAIGAIR